MTSVQWRIGVEIELLAPVGLSRLDLALAIADTVDGSVRRFFHPQSEPSLVPGSPVFHNLTLGYEVLDSKQQIVAFCVDDLTLQKDLNRAAKPTSGWYRIVSDDERLLRLISQNTDPDLPLAQVMNTVAGLFGTSPECGSGGMIKVNDRLGCSIAIAAPLPGERERPCELITVPIEVEHASHLEQLLRTARALQFQVPHEGATHIHFDATALKSAHAIRNLVNIYSTHHAILKRLIGTNPNCRRLGLWSEELTKTVNAPNFRKLPWTQAREQLMAANLTKFCDLNLMNFVHEFTDKNTIEVRILPVWLEAEPILQVASLFVAIFQTALTEEVFSQRETQAYSSEAARKFLMGLPLAAAQRQYWLKTADCKQS